MYRFQDEITAEVPPCDPTTEDCPAVDPPVEEVDPAPVEETSTASMLPMVWGIVPLLDITAGLWNWSEVHDDATLDGYWDTTYMAEWAFGLIGLTAYGLGNFVGGAPFDMIWAYAVKAHIAFEVISLYLVYDAESNDGYDASTSTYYSVLVSVAGIALSVLAMVPVADLVETVEEPEAECDPTVEDCPAPECDPTVEDCPLPAPECDPTLEDCPAPADAEVAAL